MTNDNDNGPASTDGQCDSVKPAVIPAAQFLDFVLSIIEERQFLLMSEMRGYVQEGDLTAAKCELAAWDELATLWETISSKIKEIEATQHEGTKPSS